MSSGDMRARLKKQDNWLVIGTFINAFVIINIVDIIFNRERVIQVLDEHPLFFLLMLYIVFLYPFGLSRDKTRRASGCFPSAYLYHAHNPPF